MRAPVEETTGYEIEGLRINNRLILSLPVRDFEAVKPLLQRVPLRRGQVLQERDRVVDKVHFIENGIASMFFRTRRDGLVGVAIVSRFGLVGLPAVLGTSRSPHRCTVQIPGDALQIASSDLEAALEVIAPLRRVLNRYVQALLVQQSQIVLCVSCHKLEERLSSWLLAVSDRVETGEIPVTHELVSRMLGVRRPSITEAVGNLEAAGAVARSRGRITVLDRSKLQSLSCECYKDMSAEYLRLLGESRNGYGVRPQLTDVDGGPA